MSNNSAFYLKYRPQTLLDLLGQDSVKKIISASFQNNKLSHAYLFVGPRGTGKTSTARILAKMVNCFEEQNQPCNKCDSCLSITDGSNMDLIEIDAASNRGIEDIRSLREKIKLSPTASKKKVYIIDEVHMLTPEAFNALLKTLEEPPSHVLFILATTDINKVPQTILSRVQRLDFKLATSMELSEALRKIVKEEKIDIEEEALKILVKKAEGSFRDGVKLLDQVSSAGEKITAGTIDQSFRSSGFENILGLLQSVKEKNSASGLLNLNKQLENGVSVKDLLFSLMDTFRNLVLIKSGVGEELVKTNLTEDKYESLVKISEDFTNKDFVKNLDILQGALEKLKFASIQSLPLELAVVEMCSSVAAPESKQTTSEDPINIVSQEASHNDDAVSNHSQSINESKMIEVAQDDKLTTPDSPDILKLKEKWTFVLETIRPFNFSLEALLRSIKIVECTEGVVKMEVPYSFHQRILESSKNRDLLEGVLSDVLGRSIRISVTLGVRPQRTEDIANIELAADDEIIRAAAEIFNSDTVN